MNIDKKFESEIVGIAALHLDQIGYGPAGQHTRSQWRELCLSNFLAGPRRFLDWQKSWSESITKNLPPVRHSYKVTLKNRLTLIFDPKEAPTQTFDFIGESIEGEFKDYVFLQKALFIGSTFFGNTEFEGAIFHEVNFSKAVFTGAVNFRSANLGYSPDFRETQFKKTACFNKAKLLGGAEFQGSIFFGIAEFVDSTFGEFLTLACVDFSDTSFKNKAYFDGATFFIHARFDSAIFGGDASFRGATYEFGVRFNNAQFERVSDFRGFTLDEVRSSISDSIKLSQNPATKIGIKAEFENVTFKNVGHFERVRFFSKVPSFLGVDNTTTRLEFSDDSYFPKHDRTEDAVTRLGHLKRLADEHGQTDQALNFNALELHAKAGLATTSGFTKLVTWVYGAVSNYGQSFSRPVATYAILLLITLLLATAHAAFSLSAKDCEGARWNVLSDLRRTTAPCLPASDDKLHLSGYRAAAEYTLYRAAGVLDFSDNDKSTDAVARRLFGQPIEPWWMRIWGVFKAIASTALLFLTALGLRNKYRIK